VCKVQEATGRGTMALFYGMIINTAVLNALLIYAHNMHRDQPEKKKKKEKLRIAHDLVTPFVTQ